MADEDKKTTEEKDPKTLAAVEAEAKSEEKGVEAKTEGSEAKSEEGDKKPEVSDEKKPENEDAKSESEEKKEAESAGGGEKKPENEISESDKTEADDKKVDVEDTEKPKKKRFGFSFGKKKSEEKQSTEGEEKKPTEVKGEMAQLIKEFELAQQVNEKIEEKADFFVVKVKKSVVMLLLGILVIAMWAIPVSQGIKLYMSQKGISITLPFINKENGTQDASGSAQLQESGPKIRIRDSSQTEDGAKNLATKLEGAGFNAVEVQIDAENEYNGIGLIVKPGEDGLRQQIMAALGEEYEVGSPSAELTADSDFDAVILFGKSSKVKGETDTVTHDGSPSPEATASGDKVNE